MLEIYSIFHLNLAYSSIKEKQKPEVIRKCYWPLLELSDSCAIPVGIELSGYTAEQINIIDQGWIRKARLLLQKKKLEIIGSGYSQIIGPLVPAELNYWNQKLGLAVYARILMVRPKIALVNEQAYASGLVAHYKKAGYKAMIMEWNNPYRFHPEWDKRWKYYPQIACDNYGKAMPLIWNDAIAFQKFQRYAHAEIELDDYLVYLESNIGPGQRLFSIYGNDAEIFDFRPHRFSAEAKLNPQGEWNRIKGLFKKLKEDKRFKFILPAQALRYSKCALAGNKLHLESEQQPIPVKKQEKYNITRWAVTGRDDTGINTKCYRLYNYLRDCEKTGKNKIRMKALWKKLCYFWSSDFRTHIEKRRWEAFRKELNKALKRTQAFFKKSAATAQKKKQYRDRKIGFNPKIERTNSEIKIETDKNTVVLNTNKGLAISSLVFKDISPKPLVGTIPHGYYDDIGFAADFFTGHTIIEENGKEKVTDLEKIGPILPKSLEECDISIPVKCFLRSGLGEIKKEIRIYLSESRVDIRYTFNLSPQGLASIRTGIITILPDSFNKRALYYKTVNGGYAAEKFSINENSIQHAQPVNRLISSSHCLGATEGWVEIGDGHKCVRISSDKSELYNVPMISYQRVDSSYFLRCYHSIREIDETAKPVFFKDSKIGFSIYAVKFRR